MPSKEAVLNNWIIKGLEEIGQKPEDNIYTWSQGTGFHNFNLLNFFKENEIEPAVQNVILRDMWKYIHSVGETGINETLGLSENPEITRINETMNGVMGDRNHPAILGMGDYVEEALYNWVRLFALYDFAAYTFMEKHLGSKVALKIYMAMWESFALGALDHFKQALGIDKPEDVDMKVIGRLSRMYWEAIACSYHPTQDTEYVHEAELGDCPYWCNMRDMLGDEKARSMSLKTLAVVSVNYYDAILKALGVFDKYSFTMDRFQCCGDKNCRIRFERRQ